MVELHREGSAPAACAAGLFQLEMKLHEVHFKVKFSKANVKEVAAK